MNLSLERQVIEIRLVLSIPKETANNADGAASKKGRHRARILPQAALDLTEILDCKRIVA